MLTTAAVRGAKPRARPYKLADEKGLFLYVAPTGLRSWRMSFRFGGKEKLLTFGTFPDIGLADARDRRDGARAQLRQNIDPSGARRRALEDAQRLAAGGMTFEPIARAWHGHKATDWSIVHAADVLESLERDVFPAIGKKPIPSIDAPAVLKLLRTVEARGSIETAHRIRQRISDIFAYAISEGVASANPAAIVGEALKRPPRPKRQPALTAIAALRELLESVDSTGAADSTKACSQLLALTVVRSAIARGAEWAEFEDVAWDGDDTRARAPLWRVPAARMKLVQDRKEDDAYELLVPLSRQAEQLLVAWRRSAPAGAFLFPGQRDRRRPISENTLAALYARCGFAGRHVPHGWRAAFSTILNERRPGDRAIIDLALGHVPKDKVEGAYNRALHLERRRELLQEWADLLLTTG